MTGERIVADDVGIQITEENKILADYIKRKLDKTIPPSTDPGCSIYREPKKIREINIYAYKPLRTSIGPFHHGKSDRFDEHGKLIDHKSRYDRELLSRNTPMGTNMLAECVAYVKRIEDEVRKCYSEPINLSSDEFVELMVTDGLFMIELFRKYAHIGKIERHDPIFRDEWGLRSSVKDLVLLENQIPMVVLDCLFKVLALKKELKDVTLNILALKFLDQLMPRGEKVIRTSFSGCGGKHILDLLRKTYFHNLPQVGNEKKNSLNSIHCVTELKRAGVKFAVGSTFSSFLDIKFNDGVMEIPPVAIQYGSYHTLLRNFIAYEQCCDENVSYVTSYAFLMDGLIKTGQDVGKLCCEVTIANFYYSELCDKLSSYYETRLHGCGYAWRKLRDSLERKWSKN
ncbi:hypothetical protein MKX03_015837 [Papaver bracteatum]|nr:hypothetical protein MKX03_015837 [Papaver bracteatum]